MRRSIWFIQHPWRHKLPTLRSAGVPRRCICNTSRADASAFFNTSPHFRHNCGDQCGSSRTHDDTNCLHAAVRRRPPTVHVRAFGRCAAQWPGSGVMGSFGRASGHGDILGAKRAPCRPQNDDDNADEGVLLAWCCGNALMMITGDDSMMTGW